MDSSELIVSTNSFTDDIVWALWLKDPYTAIHSRNVSDLVERIARILGYQEDEVADLRVAGLLHDAGKVIVPNEVLTKPGILTPSEWAWIERHPAEGASIAAQAGFSSAIVNSIRDHHERLDGSGYPNKLSGQAIGLFSQVVAVADVYDAMTTNRPYRPGLPEKQALKELRNPSLYDQRIVKSLCDALRLVS